MTTESRIKPVLNHCPETSAFQPVILGSKPLLVTAFPPPPPSQVRTRFLYCSNVKHVSNFNSITPRIFEINFSFEQDFEGLQVYCVSTVEQHVCVVVCTYIRA